MAVDNMPCKKWLIYPSTYYSTLFLMILKYKFRSHKRAHEALWTGRDTLFFSYTFHTLPYFFYTSYALPLPSWTVAMLLQSVAMYLDAL
jgi:hypothetical protein